jgi:D-cysteine desulfhydrase
LGQGLEPIAVRSLQAVPAKLLRVFGRGDYFVPIGGSGFIGTLGYIAAVTELADQIRQGLVAEPDYIVAALGSGGTVAGLLAGVVARGLRSRVVGVDVSGIRAAALPLIVGLAHRAAKRLGTTLSLPRLVQRLQLDHEFLGAGYGHATAAGVDATETAGRLGLELDPTYTSKAFAKALQLLKMTGAEPAKNQGPLRVLYWHTLSAVPLEPLLWSAPPTLPASLSKLFAPG